MKAVVIVAHPNKASFNHAIAGRVRQTLENNGHEVLYHDLYEENFKPVFINEHENGKDELVLRHRRHMKEADAVFIVHPNWWGQPPAILKGWVDKVLFEGVAYKFPEGVDGGGVPIGLLRAGVVQILNTSDTPEERERAEFHDPLDTIWKNCIFKYCGVLNVHRKVFRVIASSTEPERIAWLDEVEAITTSRLG